MAAATKKQIQLIYVIGSKCELTEPGNSQDNLHNLVYQITGKESISELSTKEAAAVIERLRSEEAGADETVNAFISEAQIKKIFGMMYELAKLSPSDVKIKKRLCGIIYKELRIKTDPRMDIFKGFSERQGAALIEALKRYIRQAKKKGNVNGSEQA